MYILVPELGCSLCSVKLGSHVSFISTYTNHMASRIHDIWILQDKNYGAALYVCVMLIRIHSFHSFHMPYLQRNHIPLGWCISYVIHSMPSIFKTHVRCKREWIVSLPESAMPFVATLIYLYFLQMILTLPCIASYRVNCILCRLWHNSCLSWFYNRWDSPPAMFNWPISE